MMRACCVERTTTGGAVRVTGREGVDVFAGSGVFGAATGGADGDADGVGISPCERARPNPVAVIWRSAGAGCVWRYDGTTAAPTITATASAPAHARMRMNA